MGLILYKAPNCLRCDIVKKFLEEKNLPYEAFQLDTEKDVVNGFYRTNRARLYRNVEGAEFPMFHDTDNDVILQGTGLVLAYLLAGKALDSAVTRSDLLHGWISGLYVSQVAAGEEEQFLELIRLLAKGGLQVCLQSDGRKADLLEKIMAENLLTKIIVNIPGPADVYPDAVGGPAPSADELKKTLTLARTHKDHVIRLWLTPIRPANKTPYWLSPAQAGDAAKMVAEASGEMTMPFAIQADAEKHEGVDPLDENLLPFRAKVRNHLPKADIVKA